jgi:hypothetical protein
VLDALDSVGLRGDGRLTALSSYENRVYQVQLEDGSAVVAKFYRPGRWTDEQIQEEHDFAAELMAAEVPAIGPLVLQGASLHHFGDFAFSVSPRRGGRPPELDDGRGAGVDRPLSGAHPHRRSQETLCQPAPAGRRQLWCGVHAVAAGARQGAAGRAIGLGQGVHRRY